MGRPTATRLALVLLHEPQNFFWPYGLCWLMAYGLMAYVYLAAENTNSLSDQCNQIRSIRYTRNFLTFCDLVFFSFPHVEEELNRPREPGLKERPTRKLCDRCGRRPGRRLQCQICKKGVGPCCLMAEVPVPLCKDCWEPEPEQSRRVTRSRSRRRRKGTLWYRIPDWRKATRCCECSDKRKDVIRQPDREAA